MKKRRKFFMLFLGIEHPNGSYAAKLENAMWPYGSSSVVPYTNYANFHQDCINACLTRFLQYSPFILLIEVNSMYRRNLCTDWVYFSHVYLQNMIYTSHVHCTNLVYIIHCIRLGIYFSCTMYIVQTEYLFENCSVSKVYRFTNKKRYFIGLYIFLS